MPKSRVFRHLPSTFHIKKGKGTEELTFQNINPRIMGIVGYTDTMGEVHFFREDKLRVYLNLPEYEWE